MEFIIECILDIVLDMGVEASKSKKIPKCIRYLILICLVIFFLSVIGVIYFMAFLFLKENILLFLIFNILATFMLIGSVIKFKKIYLTKK